MKLVYILANPRSGSTLTNLILAALDRSVSLGEIVRLSMDEAQRIHSFGNRCKCKTRIKDCEVWSDRAHHILSDHTKDWSELNLYPKPNSARYPLRLLSYAVNLGWLRLGLGLPDPLKREAQNTWQFFDQLADVTDSEILIDSTKTVTRFLNLYRADPDRTLLVYLSRSPLGVFSSHMKRFQGAERPAGAVAAAKWLASEQSKMASIYRAVPSSAKFHISYERLCENPNAILDEVATRLGTTHRGIESRVNIENHDIPGSEHTRLDSLPLRQDLGWQQALSAEEINLVAEYSEAYMAEFGYSTEKI